MTNPEKQFKDELSEFRKEVDQCIYYFYTYITINSITAERKSVLDSCNRTPRFWNALLAALQTSTIITLGRIFDQGSPHNIDCPIRIAQQNSQIFSKDALSLRKHNNYSQKPAWLDQYIQEAYIPTPQDFRRLRSHIKRRRNIYILKYRPLRHEIFAHKVLSDINEISELFKQTNLVELEQLVVFLSCYHNALWELYMNGNKPVLRPQRYSVKKILRFPLPLGYGKTLQEDIILETEKLLLSLPIQK